VGSVNHSISEETRAKLAGRRVVASVSGGKDSAALSLWLTEHGIEHERVFLDTGWEHAKTYEYLRGPLTEKIGAIVEVKAPLGFADLVRKKGMFPSRTVRFCTQELKVFPMAEWLAAQRSCTQCKKPMKEDELGAKCECGGSPEQKEIVNAVGIRREEITRYGPRTLDTDNLGQSTSGVQDEVIQMLKGTPGGEKLTDSPDEPRVRIRLEQRKGKHGVEIEIRSITRETHP
jgi:hypothetical protein